MSKEAKKKENRKYRESIRMRNGNNINRYHSDWITYYYAEWVKNNPERAKENIKRLKRIKENGKHRKHSVNSENI